MAYFRGGLRMKSRTLLPTTNDFPVGGIRLLWGGRNEQNTGNCAVLQTRTPNEVEHPSTSFEWLCFWWNNALDSGFAFVFFFPFWVKRKKPLDKKSRHHRQRSWNSAFNSNLSSYSNFWVIPPDIYHLYFYIYPYLFLPPVYIPFFSYISLNINTVNQFVNHPLSFTL